MTRTSSRRSSREGAVRRRASRFCVLLLFLLIAAGAQGSSKVEVPDWVRQAAHLPVGVLPSRTNAVVLLDETSLTFTGTMEYAEFHREVIRILRPEGRDEGEFVIDLDPGDRIQNVHAWSLTAGGAQFELKDKEFYNISPWGGNELYSDELKMAGKVSGADVGSVVALEYSVQRRPLISLYSWNAQRTIPVRKASLTIVIPSGWQYRASFANIRPQEPRTEPDGRITWTLKDQPGIDDEQKHRPSDSALLVRAEIAVYAPGDSARLDSWKSVGAWQSQLTSPRWIVTPEIREKVQTLTAGVMGFDAILRRLAAFVQHDIRYVAVEIGIGGWQPHFAAETFKHRYGDCKDKAALLGTMLNSAGIRSYLLGVNYEHGTVFEEMPSIGSFNHAILAILLPTDAPNYRSTVTASDGRKFLIFDPTNDVVPLGELPYYEQGNFALLATENGGELVKLPVPPPDASRLERTGRFQLAADGSLSGEVTETRAGKNAEYFRTAFLSSDQAERVRIMERYTEQSLNGLTLKDYAFENLEEIEKELVMHCTIAGPRYAQSSGPLLLLRADVLGYRSFALQWKTRTYPVQLSGVEREVDDYEIQLPDGYVVDDLPDAAQIDVGFASYRSRFENAGNTVRYWREYVVRDPFVPLTKMADLRRLEERISQDELASVVLKKK